MKMEPHAVKKLRVTSSGKPDYRTTDTTGGAAFAGHTLL